MGTWLGHAAPGTYFVVFSIWWTVRTMQDYYSKQGRFINTAGKSCCCQAGCFKRIHGEGVAVVATALSGVIAEIITGLTSEDLLPMANIQHLTMYVGFGIAGFTELMLHHQYKFLPKQLDYLTMIAALLIEMVLFAFHLHGRSEMDKHVHMLLVYTIAGCIISTALEMNLKRSVQAAMTRHFFFMLQGTWFIQIGFLLYNPIPGSIPWNGDEPESVMKVTLIFAWHMICCILAMYILSAMTYGCCCRQQHDSDEEKIGMTLMSKHHRKNGRPRDGQVQETSLLVGYNSLDEYEEDNLFVQTPPPSTSNT